MQLHGDNSIGTKLKHFTKQTESNIKHYKEMQVNGVDKLVLF